MNETTTTTTLLEKVSNNNTCDEFELDFDFAMCHGPYLY
jgi:hypothetical protein